MSVTSVAHPGILQKKISAGPVLSVRRINYSTEIFHISLNFSPFFPIMRGVHNRKHTLTSCGRKVLSKNRSKKHQKDKGGNCQDMNDKLYWRMSAIVGQSLKLLGLNFSTVVRNLPFMSEITTEKAFLIMKPHGPAPNSLLDKVSQNHYFRA